MYKVSASALTSARQRSWWLATLPEIQCSGAFGLRHVKLAKMPKGQGIGSREIADGWWVVVDGSPHSVAVLASLKSLT